MFLVIKKRTVIFFVLAIIVAAALIVAMFKIPFADASVYFGNGQKELPIYRVETNKKEIALTFDTAYGEDKTLEIVKILKEYDADATFFMAGIWIENFEAAAKAVADQGFEIGSHSNTHPHFNRLTEKQMTDELSKSVSIIKEKTGFTPTLFRAPYGEYNDKLLAAAKKQNLQTIQWSVDSLDWKDKIAAADIAARILAKANNGSIILMHNNAQHILTYLPAVLASLKDNGYSFVRVSNLIHKDNFVIDNKGTQKRID